MSEPKKIGQKRYEFLKGLIPKALTDEDFAAIELYEKEQQQTDDQVNEHIEAYRKKLFEMVEQSFIKIDPIKLAKAFIRKWNENNTDSLLQLTSEMGDNLRILNYYLSGDDQFQKGCEANISVPDLKKGILIIGGFGNGKSQSLKIYKDLLCRIEGYSFKSFTANQVVDMYEACENQADKSDFWKKMTTGTAHFDDVLTEREANNYGKVQIFKDVFEKRYDNGLKTYVTCNIRHANNIRDGLEQFSEKYGERVYDRLFEMFNILHWKGKSFRK